MGIDEEGNQLFQKNYSFEGQDYANLNIHNMIPSVDGNYLAALRLTKIFDNNEHSYPNLTKFNADGDTLWTKNYSPQPLGDYEVSSVIQGSDGSVYMCGSHFNIGDFILSKGFIMKTDSEGNYQWHLDIGPGYFTRLFDIKLDNDIIYAVGQHYYDGADQQEPNKQYVVKCNTNGILYWANAIDPLNSTGKDWRAETCIVKDDGKLLVGAGYSIGNWQSTHKRPMVMEIDNLTGEVNWKKGFGAFQSSDHIEQIKILADGNYVATGLKTVWETGAEGDRAPFILKFSPEGDSIWMRTIIPLWFETSGWPGAKGTMSDFVINDDGGITAIGELATYTGDGPQDGWIQDTYILRLDSLGCLVPGCDTLVNVAEESVEKMALSLYPNPASGVLNVHFENVREHQQSTFEIINNSGQLIRTWQTPIASATFQVNVSDLLDGLYLLRISDDSGSCIQEKFFVFNTSGK
jgi:outer membrane protein assembly factor BamB